MKVRRQCTTTSTKGQRKGIKNRHQTNQADKNKNDIQYGKLQGIFYFFLLHWFSSFSPRFVYKEKIIISTNINIDTAEDNP